VPLPADQARAHEGLRRAVLSLVHRTVSAALLKVASHLRREVAEDLRPQELGCGGQAARGSAQQPHARCCVLLGQAAASDPLPRQTLAPSWAAFRTRSSPPRARAHRTPPPRAAAGSVRRVVWPLGLRRRAASRAAGRAHGGRREPEGQLLCQLCQGCPLHMPIVRGGARGPAGRGGVGGSPAAGGMAAREGGGGVSPSIMSKLIALFPKAPTKAGFPRDVKITLGRDRWVCCYGSQAMQSRRCIWYFDIPSPNTTVFGILWPPSIALWGSLVPPYTLSVQ
jgi:hypothetical protein